MRTDTALCLGWLLLAALLLGQTYCQTTEAQNLSSTASKNTTFGAVAESTTVVTKAVDPTTKGHGNPLYSSASHFLIIASISFLHFFY